MISNSGDDKESISESLEREKKSGRKATRKIASHTLKSKNANRPTSVKRRIISDGYSENEAKSDMGPDIAPIKPTKKKAKKGSLVKEGDTEEDVPLKVFKKPSDEELKKRVLNLLEEVNLETTSLRVVRDKIFEYYPNFDLTDKKDFINSVVKQVSHC
ncbi:unnamed protein product [Protopolystoma xenopodis]|uniref:DEK-C domain-containing protein n=1 Tax=Protopolystoma xenopodis TaxID=117903 RepID=A0A3S5AB84_9PLAT|nr:unnamed protein product [Protopolystoma xenopodis]